MSEDETREHQQSEKARRANRIFEEHVRPKLNADADSRAYVAMDLESNDFEVHENQLTAADRLLERHPEAEGRLWFRRVGSPVTHHLSGRVPQTEERL